jgi:hypothetical protein
MNYLRIQENFEPHDNYLAPPQGLATGACFRALEQNGVRQNVLTR